MVLPRDLLARHGDDHRSEILDTLRQSLKGLIRDLSWSL